MVLDLIFVPASKRTMLDGMLGKLRKSVFDEFFKLQASESG